MRRESQARVGRRSGGAGSSARWALRAATVLLVMGWACSDGGALSRGDLAEIAHEAAAEGAEADTSGSPARRAVRDSLRQVIGACDATGAEIGRLFRRPELDSYLFLDESYVGGTFPAGTAELLREVQGLEDALLAEIASFPTVLAANLEKHAVPATEGAALAQEMADAFAEERRPVVKAVEEHRKLVEVAAELYELVASQPDSIRSMREGLEIADDRLLERFNAHVDAVNAAHDATDAALGALSAEQQKSVSWMGLVKRMPE